MLCLNADSSLARNTGRHEQWTTCSVTLTRLCGMALSENRLFTANDDGVRTAEEKKNRRFIVLWSERPPADMLETEYAKSVAWFYELTPVRRLGFNSLWLESCNSLVNCSCLPESEALQYLYLTKARYGK
ncbi:hypothetical protein J6590_093312 [Homalodisca vitripennis]|nr:hypothetical protein J6590_093312 [Homalodisca vitripennis]